MATIAVCIIVVVEGAQQHWLTAHFAIVLVAVPMALVAMLVIMVRCYSKTMYLEMGWSGVEAGHKSLTIQI